MTLFGIDASDYDADRGPMDMLAMARDGITFVTHKLTEGTSVKHQNGGRVLAAARDAGIPFLGGYMVPRTPGASIAAQVDYFLAWANQICPWWREFPGWFWQVDTEFWSYDHVTANAGHQAAQLIATLTSRRVMHYAPQWAYGDNVPAGEPLWASGYVVGSGPYRALYPGDANYRWRVYSGRVPEILQYTSSATIGTQPGCDANAFRGTTDDFAALIGMGTAMTGFDVTDPKFGNGQENLFSVYHLLLDWDEMRVRPGSAYWDGGEFTPLGRGIATLQEARDGVRTLLAAAAADEARDAATLAAVQALAAVVNAGGGNVDTAAILAHIDAAQATETATVAALQQQVADLQARLARAAQAGSDVLNA